jgi:hypothetical protein
VRQQRDEHRLFCIARSTPTTRDGYWKHLLHILEPAKNKIETLYRDAPEPTGAPHRMPSRSPSNLWMQTPSLSLRQAPVGVSDPLSAGNQSDRQKFITSHTE